MYKKYLHCYIYTATLVTNHIHSIPIRFNTPPVPNTSFTYIYNILHEHTTLYTYFLLFIYLTINDCYVLYLGQSPLVAFLCNFYFFEYSLRIIYPFEKGVFLLTF